MQAPVTFTHCIVDVKEINTKEWQDDRFVSRLFFTLHYGPKSITDMWVEIRQPNGYRFDKPDEFPIEVSHPSGSYTGPIHHESFANAAEQYYRLCMSMIGYTEQARLTFRNCTFNPGIKTYMVEIPDRGSAW